MMAIQTITIEVDAETAEAYNTTSAERRRKLNALLGLKLSEMMLSARALEDVMRDMSDKAQHRGLTPEILDQILRED